jgi:hypothetical protein
VDGDFNYEAFWNKIVDFSKRSLALSWDSRWITFSNGGLGKESVGSSDAQIIDIAVQEDFWNKSSQWPDARGCVSDVRQCTH